MVVRGRADWVRELEAWSEPFLEALDPPARRHWAPYYLRGLLLPGERKSIQPMAARLGLPAHDQLHNFVASPSWDGDALEAVLAAKADALVGGRDAVLVVDEPPCPRRARPRSAWRTSMRGRWVRTPTARHLSR